MITLYFKPKIRTRSQPEMSYIISEYEKYSRRAHLNVNNLAIWGWFYRNGKDYLKFKIVAVICTYAYKEFMLGANIL